MKNLTSVGLKYIDGKLLVLNQQQLPSQEEWIICRNPEHMYEIIKTLQVRGAPLIGVAAAMALADYVEQGANQEQVITAAEMLKTARPTAVNLMHCIDRQLAALAATNELTTIVDTAESLFLEDKDLCEAMAQHGLPLIKSGFHILTHCNTGSLVTTGIGTALGVIRKAYDQHKNLHIYVDETRPLLQGGRLTAWELEQAKIPYQILCDNMAASLMQQGLVDCIIVGADRIARNGDFANKIGTYGLAVLAKHHDVPFYVAAPYTTIDNDCVDGSAIAIEQRAADEVRGAKGAFGQVIWSPENAAVYNPAFDVTPTALVSSYILDSGLHSF